MVLISPGQKNTLLYSVITMSPLWKRIQHLSYIQSDFSEF